jgi:D-sedoheptulose 7-phosphate isomerase
MRDTRFEEKTMTEEQERLVAAMLHERLELEAQALLDLRREVSTFVETVQLVQACFERGGKLILCGNGGSGALCSHAVNDFFVGVFKDQPMPAIALVDNIPTVTAVANDLGYERVFEQQLRALGEPGDVLIAVSASGNSPSVLRAVELAREKAMPVIGMTNAAGGRLGPVVDVWLRSTTTNGQITEESQLMLLHMLARCVASLLSTHEHSSAEQPQ